MNEEQRTIFIQEVNWFTLHFKNQKLENKYIIQRRDLGKIRPLFKAILFLFMFMYSGFRIVSISEKVQGESNTEAQRQDEIAYLVCWFSSLGLEVLILLIPVIGKYRGLIIMLANTYSFTSLALNDETFNLLHFTLYEL